MENKETFKGSKEVLRAIFASGEAYQMQPPGVPPPKPLLIVEFDGVPPFNVPVSIWGKQHYRQELGDEAPSADYFTQANYSKLTWYAPLF